MGSLLDDNVGGVFEVALFLIPIYHIIYVAVLRRTSLTATYTTTMKLRHR